MPSKYKPDSNKNEMTTFSNEGQKLSIPIFSIDAGIEDSNLLNSRHWRGSSDLKNEPHLPGTYIPYEIRFLADKHANSIPSKLRRLRRETFNFLEGRKTFWSRLYHHAVIFVILASIGFAVAATLTDRTDKFRKSMRHVTLGFEACLFVIFVVEYSLRVWSCSANSSYIGWRGTWKFVTKPLMILDIFVTISSFILIVTFSLSLNYEQYRYLLLLQLLRVLRIDRQRGAFKTFQCVVRNHFKELLTCWYMSFIVITFLSYLTYADPTGSSKGTVKDLANGLYWGVVSMTTIGYGDVAPKTGLSKLILCVFALIGAGFIAMPAGIIGSGFALQVIEQRKLKEKTRRRRPAAELIQGAWRVWASDPVSNCAATWLPHTKVTIHIPGSKRASQASVAVPEHVDDWEHISIASRQLTIGEKHALGFIRRLKLNVAIRNFKQSTRPYDVKDILDRFAATHVEIFERIKEVRKRVEDSIKTQHGLTASRDQNEIKLERIERKVDELTEQMSDATCLLRELLAERYIQSGTDGSNV